MKQIEKDLIIIGCIASVMQELGKKIGDVIPNFDGVKLANFAEKQSVYLSDEATDNAIIELANECYKRIQKKL